ncbi:MAG TPA: MATE family efflux transporter, partial [Sulfurospirillum arcachonense]|nr:MATE family efflux transporter [Sulfurospirillum arcachonense]
MFNVTDTFFAGEISTQALASLSLTFSIFFIIIAVAGGMGQGVTALIGNAIGKKKIDDAKQIILHVLFFAISIAIIITTIGYLSAPFLMGILGAQGEYLKEALSYINIILFGAIFYVGVFFTNAMLTSLGNTKAFRNFLVIGFFLNIILDFWFIKGGLGIEPMGVRGIAYATIIIEFLGFVYLFSVLKKTYLLQNLPTFRFDKQIIFSFFKQGTPPTINMLLMALGMFIITYYISDFGQHVVAAYGIAIRIEQIFLLPSIGINVAVLAIVSQNNGAGLYERVKESVIYAQKVGFILWIIGMLSLFAFGEFLMGLFTDDVLVIEAGLSYLYAAATSLYAYVLVFINISFLQGIKKPALLVFLSLFRQLLVPVVVFSLFAYYKLSLEFYWWGLVTFIWLSALFIVWYAKRKFSEI